jgi:hypothetical protein
VTAAPATPPTPWRRRARRQRRAGRWLAGALLLLVLAGIVAVLARHALVEWILLAELRRRGAVATLSVARVGPGVLELREVTVGSAADLAIELVEARVTPASLRAGRLAALHVRGARVRGAWTAAGISFGALDALLAGGDREAGAALVLPAEDLQIEDARLGLETARGELLATLAGRAGTGEGERIEAHAELSAQHPLFTAHGKLGAAGRADAVDASLTLDLDVDGEVAPGATVSETKLTLQAELRSRAEGLELDAKLPASPFTISIRRASGEDLLVRGEVPALRAVGRGPPEPAGFALHVEGAGGRLEARELDLEIRDLEAALDLASPSFLPVGRVGAGRILDLARPERFVPLALEGELREADGSLGFDLALAPLDGGELRVEARGRHDLRDAAGEVRIHVSPLAFEAGGLQPATLLPILGDRVRDAAGTLEAMGELSWQGGALQGGFDLALRDLSASSELADVERVNAALRVAWPLSTPAGQLLSVARLDVGLELTDGLVEFELRRDGVLAVPSAQFQFAGGRISSSAELDPEAEEQGFVLDVADLDLGQLFALVPLDGLSGQGTLAGEIPVVLRGGALEIREALLSSGEGGGWIRYQPGAEAGALAANPDMAIALRALQNFAYETLEIRVDGEAAGAVRVGVTLRGSNPDLFAGAPVEFNLNLDGELGDLVGAGMTSYQIPEEIERRLREFSERSR